MHRSINKIAEGSFSARECTTVFKIPGKCLKGRCGALYYVLCVLIGAVVILRAAFDKLWGRLGTEQEAVTATVKPMPMLDPGPSSAERSRKENPDEEPAIIRKKTRNARRRSNNLIHCDLCPDGCRTRFLAISDSDLACGPK